MQSGQLQTANFENVCNTHTMRANRRNAIVLFFIQPFFTLCLAIKNYRSTYSRNIVWFFVVFFGFTFAISNSGIDANRQRAALEALANSELTLGSITNLMYAETNGYVDAVQPLLMFIVSRFTDNYRVLFALYGFIFGYFYSRNIWFLIDHSGDFIKKFNVLILITFALIIGFWNINGFRMYTAAHIFFYGSIQYLFNKRKMGVAIASVSILFHFSYLLPVSVLLLFFAIRNRVSIFFWFYLISFFITELNLEVVRETLMDILPPVFHPKITSYTQEDYAESRVEAFGEMRWYARNYIKALTWVITGFLVIFYFRATNYLKQNEGLRSIFGFTLLLMGVINIASHIPSMGRFIAVASLFAVALIFLFLQHGPRLQILKLYHPLAIGGFLLFSIVSLRIGVGMISIMAIMGNPIIALFYNIDYTLIQFLK